MEKEKEIYRVFQSHKPEIPDDGFIEQVMRKIPRRNVALPYIILLCCFILGLTLTFAIQGSFPFFEQMMELVDTISRMQYPSLLSVATYLSGLAALGTVTLGIYRSDFR